MRAYRTYLLYAGICKYIQQAAAKVLFLSWSASYQDAAAPNSFADHHLSWVSAPSTTSGKIYGKNRGALTTMLYFALSAIIKLRKRTCNDAPETHVKMGWQLRILCKVGLGANTQLTWLARIDTLTQFFACVFSELFEGRGLMTDSTWTLPDQDGCRKIFSD